MRQNDFLKQGLSRASGIWKRVPVPAVAIASALLVFGCSETITKHGHLFQASDIQQIQPGMSQDQVKLTLGTPATQATTAQGQSYYYISSTTTQSSFFDPKEVDRQVLAVHFSQTGTVNSVANYGMKDGKVFDFISRTTPAPGGKDDGILKQLFRNLGTKQIFGE